MLIVAWRIKKGEIEKKMKEKYWEEGHMKDALGKPE